LCAETERTDVPLCPFGKRKTIASGNKKKKPLFCTRGAFAALFGPALANTLTGTATHHFILYLLKTLYLKHNLTDATVDRIIEMAWEDRTPFEAIEVQFGLTESEVIQLMKSEMTLRNWQKWRARVQGRKTKHLALRGDEVTRFRCSRQRQVTRNRISKR